MTNQSLIPVIVGVGDVIDRDCAKEPRTLIVEAAGLAGQEAPGILEQVDRVDIINVYSWLYKDIGNVVAADLGISPKSADETAAGGEKPIRMLGEAAEDLAAGKIRAALICGAEATRTRRQIAKAGATPDWGPTNENAKPLSADQFVTPLALRYGLLAPPTVYPLYENATRKAWGQTIEQSQSESAILWSRYADAAAENQYAWLGRKHDPETIKSDANGNRMISYPYRKLMVANPMVNQGAAVLVTSLAAARQAGVADDKIIFIGSGARANEPADFLSRDRYDHSTAQDAVLKATLAANNLSAAQIDLFELYSCFPTVPKMARRTLGLGDDIEPSVTGGLTFFGGPANNYMTHAITAAVRAIRNGKGSNALLYGQGEFVTKHAAIGLGDAAPLKTPTMTDVQDAADQAAGAVPDLLEVYEGPATIESFTINYDRDGNPKQAPIVCRTPAGARVVALGALDANLVGLLTSETGEPIGAAGAIAKGAGEQLIFSAAV
jgi:acetyl-CoA C-acetyltransferase